MFFLCPYSCSRLDSANRAFKVFQALAVTAVMPRQTIDTITSLRRVTRQDIVVRIVPRSTMAIMTIPAREIVRTSARTAKGSVRVQTSLRNLGIRELRAATKKGAVMQRNTER